MNEVSKLFTMIDFDGGAPKPDDKLKWLDMSDWDNQPRPQRAWAILDRVPLNQAGLFSGEGGVGKSIIEIMKDVAHVTGRDWLGSLPEPGSAFYLGAEDDENEIHIRLYDIAAHYGVTFKELIDCGLYVLCLLGQDATLCAANGKSGRVEVTNLYRQIYEMAGDIKPKNISVDTLSRAFSGNEIDRAQVYAFAMHMQALAKIANGSVTVLSHPSLQGISSGTGLSGSTHGTAHFGSANIFTASKPKMASSPTLICANSNSRRTNTDRPTGRLSCATSAACSCRYQEYRALRRPPPRLRRTTPSSNCFTDSQHKDAMSATGQRQMPTPLPC